MTREISRRTSIPPEQKGKVVRPDMAKTPYIDDLSPLERTNKAIAAAAMDYEIVKAKLERNNPAIRRGRDMDHYVGSLNPTEGLSKSTGYVDNNNGPEPRGGKDAKRK